MYYRLLKRRGGQTKPRLGYLVDLEYDGDTGRAVLFFLDPDTQTIFKWYDSTGHVSYLLTVAPEVEVEYLFEKDRDYLGVETVEKYNAILDETVQLRKVYATNPLAIGGGSRMGGSNYRDSLTGEGYNVWEAWIRYVNNYCYDTGIEVGMPYLVSKDEIVPVVNKDVTERIEQVFGEILNHVEYNETLGEYIRLFETPLPPVKSTSLDIEILPESPTTLPNPNIANQPVIAAGMVDSDGNKIVYVYRRPGPVMGLESVDGEVVFFDHEHELLLAVFRRMREYPFVVTFNGDNFDLLYLYNRASKLGIPKHLNPIYTVRRECKLRHGIHIDLYPFFNNNSIQNYAFKQKYKDYSLESISQGLLGKGKIVIDKSFEWATFMDLARYCLNDAELTHELLTFDDNIVLHLILILCRISNLTVYQMTRRKISEWVRSTFYMEMRKRNWLIPSTEELRSRGETQTEAKIEGKKYQGAIVIEPQPGIFFNVVVLDFASLYPSEVKKRNIGFSTVNCKHLDCRENQVPYTTHHICTKNRAIEADIIGGLRDARVYFYKGQAKNKELFKEQLAFYNVLEQAIKVYINASYGVFGSEAFALYVPPVAESVTAYGRRDIGAVIRECGTVGVEVLYGDTDSTGLHDPTPEQVEQLQQWATDNLDLDLGIDKVYRYAIFSTRKKNYLGVFEDNTVDIKGLTGKKTNIPDIIKEPFFEVMDLLGKVTTEDEYEEVRKDVWYVFKTTRDKIWNREWENLDELAFHTRLSMNIDQYKVNAQHVKAARKLQDSGYSIKAGDMVHYIKTTTDDGVEPLISATNEQVDIKIYLEQLESVAAQFMEPMGIEWGDISGETNLDMFITGKSFLIEFMKPPENPE